MHEIKTGVVLINYNGEKYLADCIDSLLAQTYKNIEILVWDNHSDDDSVKIMKEKYPEIHLVESFCNDGFAKANNLAVKEILKSGAEYVLLLNTDTVSDSFLVEKLLEWADDNTVTTAHICMGRNGEKVWYAGGALQPDIGDVRHFQAGNRRKAGPVTFISGCCMMIHKRIIRKYGLFDINYYLYYEDVDLCMRWFLRGVRMFYVPEAFLWHKVGASSGGSKNSFKQYYMVRNRLYFTSKYRNSMNAGFFNVLWQIIQEKILQEADFKMAAAACRGIVDFFVLYMKIHFNKKKGRRL